MLGSWVLATRCKGVKQAICSRFKKEGSSSEEEESGEDHHNNHDDDEDSSEEEEDEEDEDLLKKNANANAAISKVALRAVNLAERRLRRQDSF